MTDGPDGTDGPFRYCPRCRCEYRLGFEICTDCGVDLVDRLPAEPDPAQAPSPDLVALQSVVGSDPVAVLTTGDELQAALVRGLLVDADIPAAVWSSGFGGYFGHASSATPFGHRVMVHKDDEDEARELLAAEVEDTPGR